MTAPELKPCPFCGCTTILHRTDGGRLDYHECDLCQASGPVGPATTEYPETWNTRATPPDVAELVEALRECADEPHEKDNPAHWINDRVAIARKALAKWEGKA